MVCFLFVFVHCESQMLKMNKNNYNNLLRLKSHQDCFLQSLIHIFSSVLIPIPGDGVSIISLQRLFNSPTDLIIIKTFFSRIQPELFCVYLLVITLWHISLLDIYAPQLFRDGYHVFFSCFSFNTHMNAIYIKCNKCIIKEQILY